MQLPCLHAKVSQLYRQFLSTRMTSPGLQDLTYDFTGPPSPLPSGIVIRTPSPVSEPLTFTAGASERTGRIGATEFEQTDQDIPIRQHSVMAPTAQIIIGNDKSRSLAQYAVSVYQGCAATIPWVDLYQTLQREYASSFKR